jgi:hypothetical protein
MAHFFYERTLTQRDFLTAHGVYAEEIRGIFKHVTFTPPLEALRISRLIRTTGELEVHFRDLDHLRSIAKKLPFMHAHTYTFIKDEYATSHTCFIAKEAILHSGYTFPILSINSHHLEGEINIFYLFFLLDLFHFENLRFLYPSRSFPMPQVFLM